MAWFQISGNGFCGRCGKRVCPEWDGSCPYCGSRLTDITPYPEDLPTEDCGKEEK